MKYGRRLGPPLRLWVPFFASGAFTEWLLISPKAAVLTADRKWVVLLPLVAAWLYVGQPWRVLIERLQMIGGGARPSRGRQTRKSPQVRRKRVTASTSRRTTPRAGSTSRASRQRAEAVPDDFDVMDETEDDDSAQVIQLPRVAREAVLEHLLDNFDDIVTSAHRKGR